MGLTKYKYKTIDNYLIKINDYELLYIPRFFLWDGDSIVWDTCRLASCVHDFLYGDQKKFLIYSKLEQKWYYRRINRSEADEIYLKTTNAIFKHIRYIGIRCFGWLFWDKTKNEYGKLEYNNKIESCEHLWVYIKNGDKLIKRRFKYEIQHRDRSGKF